MKEKGSWRKVLYEDQGVPDDYVDDSFLEELRKNLYIRDYEYWSVVAESGVVTQHISCVALFVVVFVYMDENRLSPETLFIFSLFCALLGYYMNNFMEQRNFRIWSRRTRWDDLKTVIIILAFSGGLSPVLMTLTDTISTDTVYAMTAFMLLANILFHDYGANAAMVSDSLSFNAGIFASVCLASRLETTWHAFATVTLAIELFALWPVLRRKLKTHYQRSQVALPLLMGTVASMAIWSVSITCAIVFISFQVFVSFACPAWLLNMQRFKNNIHGPWDEAVIRS
ncbi:DgyrCDS5734 [Dimorphilus gyrociliatus]|uniref:DgyrCDS5734 n=2 Tax=Dimorphilus gyrociliatus TaxID=2664684 RepID=A0A7I8VKX2_9ANNE|nr:DgyrCDS5734 [Dimorphilus gyrociliatus]